MYMVCEPVGNLSYHFMDRSWQDHDLNILNYDSSLRLHGPASSLCFFVEAPHRWRHALLADLRSHVKIAINDGSYVPLLTGGLD